MSQKAKAAAIQRFFDKLVEAPLHKFPATGYATEAGHTHGVYIIRDGRGRVLHVGRSIRGKNGLSQRLGDHLKGTSSFCCGYVKNPERESEGMSAVRKRYLYQFIEIDDPLDRGLLESLAVGKLCPLHFGVGLSLSKSV